MELLRFATAGSVDDGKSTLGRVSLRTTVPLFFDEYRRNRATGSFILVDEAANNTVGAGIIIGPTGVA